MLYLNRQNRLQKDKCTVTFILENDNDNNYIDIIQIIVDFYKDLFENGLLESRHRALHVQ